MAQSEAKPLAGLTVLSLESRRAAEITELLRRHGATPLSAPSMREVPIEENPAAVQLLHRLEAGEIDALLVLTGVGLRALGATLGSLCPRQRLAELLRRVVLVARGPKPVAVLREMGLAADIVVPEPNTWRELLATLDARSPVAGRRLAVQEYGASNTELIDALRARGAEVFPVPVYRWELPEDLEPLQAGIQALAGGAVDIAVFTSAHQVDNLLQVASQMGARNRVLDASGRFLIASIGPICSQSLLGHGLAVDLEPEHPKMGHLVAAVARCGRGLLEAKRSGASASAKR
jgi:uroporphyrinogen-III synthase